MLISTDKHLSSFFCRNRKVLDSGFTLIEVLVTIVVISIAATSIMGVFMNTVKTSADPLIQQQAIAIAEAYMEEIQSKKFCQDVTLPMVAPPPQAMPTCLTETGGKEGVESRSTFNDIQDYNDSSVDGVARDQNDVAIAGLGGYSVAVVVSAAALGGITAASGNAMRIDITVNHAAIDSITLSGFRTNY